MPENPAPSATPKFVGPKRNPKDKKELYGLRFPSVMDAIAIEMHMIQNGSIWIGKQGQTIGMGAFFHYRRLQQLLWPKDVHHRWSDLMLSEILNNTITAIMGPKDCIAGHTRIPNPITGESPTVEELCNAGIQPIVMTMNGPVKASVPWLKGEDDLYEITCENGRRFTATAGHLVLSSHGFVRVDSLYHGQALQGYDDSPSSSISVFSPLEKQKYDAHLFQIVPNSQSCYRPSLRSYDEQPQSVSGIFQDTSPSQVCVLEHIPNDLQKDVSDYAQEYIHDHQRFCRLSNLDYDPCKISYKNRTERLQVLETALLVRQLFQQPLLYPLTLILSASSSESNLCSHESDLVSACELSLISSQFQPCEAHSLLCCDEIQISEKSEKSNDIHKRIEQSHNSFPQQLGHGDALLHFRVLQTSVQEIKHVGRGKFYDLTVPKEHHYFADGFLHHNSGKTHVALTRYALTDYFCHPLNTLIMISSTDVRGLELRVWGDMKTMFKQAKERYPSLPGHLIDSKHAVATDNLIEDGTRDLRRGIICLPTLSSGGTWQGLGKYVGIKQKRRRLLGDEVPLMRAGFLDALANLNSGDQEGNEFKGVFVGNPLGIGDPLDRIAEPKNGWGTEGEITKTTVWDNRFEKGRTINLVGTDSPNFDYPPDEPVKYPWMINAKSIEAVASFYGKDSLQYWSQCKGVRKAGLNGRRVITRNLCIKFKAMEDVAWKNDQQVKLYAVDAAYGEVGGDRCVGGSAKFGRDVNGDMIFAMNPHVIIPVKAGTDVSPEDQIAEFVRQDCISQSIPAGNVYYDATGRGSLGTAFARIWSPLVNPIEFGGRATNRQVSAELMIIDPETQKSRPKLCVEHFSKFVTELWFMVRYVIESGQFRGLTEEVLEDGMTREWKMVSGNKIEIESKIDTKERMGRSPDLFDWLATLIEGARQKGFVLRALAAPQKRGDDSWKDTLRKRAADLHHSGDLNYAV